MRQVAVFVDAGYLFAAGSQLISGTKQRRADLLLDEPAIRSELANFATSRDANSSLLRIYWYDGIGGGRETDAQQRIAEMADVKMRYGVINSVGQQKGVDSLIVTDIVDLARARVVSSAVVLAGDEDVRIGVEIAQRYGVRVHLLGIVPSRGNQSPLLRREADTKSEWDAATLRGFLSVVPLQSTIASPAGVIQTPALAGQSTASQPTAPAPSPQVSGTAFEQAASQLAAQMNGSQATEILAAWDAGSGVPSIYDSRLLSAGGALLPRPLELSEKRTLRKLFADALRALPPAGSA